MSNIRGEAMGKGDNNTPEYDFLVEANALATEVGKSQLQPQPLSFLSIHKLPPKGKTLSLFQRSLDLILYCFEEDIGLILIRTALLLRGYYHDFGVTSLLPPLTCSKP